MSELQIPRTIDIQRGERGFFATVGHDNRAHLGPLYYAFDHATDLVAWLIEQYTPAPIVTPDPIRGPATAQAPHACETDLRQGVTFIQHAVLDLYEERQQEWNTFSIAELIRTMKWRVDPMTIGSKMQGDIANAIEACALLIAIAQRTTDCLHADAPGGAA